jgi:outer membrane immunogenic protein
LVRSFKIDYGMSHMPVWRKGRIVMRKASLTLVAAAIGMAASQASAADLPRKAPAYIPPAPPPITWTGCYVGGNIGGAFGHASLSTVGGSVSLKTILALPPVVRSAAIINSAADG